MQIIELDCLTMEWGWFEAIKRRHLREQCRVNDARLRRLLGAWVSESEPAACFDWDNNLIGLCRAEDPTGSIVLRPTH